MSYDIVVEALKTKLDWPTTVVAPAPNATQAALDAGQLPEDVARRLDTYCYDRAAQFQPPYGYPGTAYEYFRYENFSIGREYWELNTQIALGQTVETWQPLAKAAQSTMEWYELQNRNINRLGDQHLCDPSEWPSRLEHAAAVPIEWTRAGCGEIWQLCVREGYIPTGLSGFVAAYTQSTPSLDEVRGFDAQMYLDNLRCRDTRKPVKWLRGGVQNPEWKP